MQLSQPDPTLSPGQNSEFLKRLQALLPVISIAIILFLPGSLTKDRIAWLKLLEMTPNAVPTLIYMIKKNLSGHVEPDEGDHPRAQPPHF